MEFKAWDNKNKRWLDAFFVNQNGEVYSFSVDNSHNYQIGACIINHRNLVDATLCRSTGHKDIRGNIIFEHDILKDYMKRISFVKYRPDYAMFMQQDTQGFQGGFEWKNEKGFEIIGNIFENKNLLENKNDK
jgi:uncharacterized phage protein (TIGR01671 family)